MSALSERVARVLAVLELPIDPSIVGAGAIVVRPLSHLDYLRRARSFRLSLWFAQLPPLAPLVLARFGWMNVSHNTIECEGCGAQAQPRGTDLPSALAAARALRGRGAHKKGCAWARASSPRAFADLPSARAARVIVALEAKRLAAVLGAGEGGGSGAVAAGTRAREAATAVLALWAPFFFDPNSDGSVATRALIAAAGRALLSTLDCAIEGGEPVAGGPVAGGPVAVCLPSASTAALLAVAGWRCVVSPTAGAKRPRDDTQLELQASSLHSLVCHLCGEVTMMGEGAVLVPVLEHTTTTTHATAPPLLSSTPISPATLVTPSPAAPPPPAPPSALIAAVRGALAAAAAAVAGFTGDAVSATASSSAPVPASASASAPALASGGGLPRHFWCCPYTRTSAIVGGEVRTAVTRAIEGGGREISRQQTLDAHVGAALCAIVHAAGDAHGVDATALRLITNARRMGAGAGAGVGIDIGSDDAFDSDSGLAEETTIINNDTKAIRGVPGWLLVLLQVIAVDGSVVAPTPS